MTLPLNCSDKAARRRLWYCPIGCDLVLRTGDCPPHRHRLVLGHLYWEHDLSQSQIGMLLGYSKRAIQKNMSAAGVPRRSRPEAHKLRWQTRPLSPEVCAKIAMALMGRPRPQRVRRAISRGKRAYEYGVGIIRRLREGNIDIALAYREPTTIGRAMMGLKGDSNES